MHRLAWELIPSPQGVHAGDSVAELGEFLGSSTAFRARTGRKCAASTGRCNPRQRPGRCGWNVEQALRQSTKPCPTACPWLSRPAALDLRCEQANDSSLCLHLGLREIRASLGARIRRSHRRRSQDRHHDRNARFDRFHDFPRLTVGRGWLPPGNPRAAAYAGNDALKACLSGALPTHRAKAPRSDPGIRGAGPRTCSARRPALSEIRWAA
jgi:hypothetical protein